MNLYITADHIGAESGGGLVTKHESESMLAPCQIWDRQVFLRGDPLAGPEPWSWDEKAIHRIPVCGEKYQLAHFYSGSFPRTVYWLKHGQQCVVTYTVAAHDKEISQREHARLGIGFPYPHLVESGLWQRYIDGYRNADVIICPGTVPAETVRRYGRDFEKKRIEIIPHGCTLPETVAPLPGRFTVGYMGSIGADKGIVYLLQAWKKMDYKDGSVLRLAGRDSTSDWMGTLFRWYGGGNVQFAGWQQNVSDFYNSLSIYVQPSATEGFGLEILEAMAHARPVLCSDAAGAVDLVVNACRVKACDVDDLAQKIDFVKKQLDLERHGQANRMHAESCTWPKIRERYVSLWRSLL